jgi:thiol-disulfide isomerase/thioredoxin
VVLLQFWTTWCPVCRGQEAAINSIVHDFTSDGLVVIAVDVGEDAQTVKDYLAAHTRSCDIVLEGDTNLVRAFRPPAFPYYVLIDRQGDVSAAKPGGGERWLRWELENAGLGRSSTNAAPGTGQPSSVPEATPPVSAKVIEIPSSPSTQPAKPRQPTVFVLKKGEKIEARRYTIQGGLLRLTVEGKERTIPLTDLDLKATTAANEERGINLKIPTNPNELVMGF